MTGKSSLLGSVLWAGMGHSPRIGRVGKIAQLLDIWAPVFPLVKWRTPGSYLWVMFWAEGIRYKIMVAVFSTEKELKSVLCRYALPMDSVTWLRV